MLSSNTETVSTFFFFFFPVYTHPVPLHLLNCLCLNSRVFLVTVPIQFSPLFLQWGNEQVAGRHLVAGWGEPTTRAKLLKLARMANTVKKEMR